LQLDRFEPWVIPRRLVKVAMYANVAVHRELSF
jgi:hypothetical protein